MQLESNNNVLLSQNLGLLEHVREGRRDVEELRERYERVIRVMWQEAARVIGGGGNGITGAGKGGRDGVVGDRDCLEGDNNGVCKQREEDVKLLQRVIMGNVDRVTNLGRKEYGGKMERLGIGDGGGQNEGRRDQTGGGGNNNGENGTFKGGGGENNQEPSLNFGSAVAASNTYNHPMYITSLAGVERGNSGGEGKDVGDDVMSIASLNSLSEAIGKQKAGVEGHLEILEKVGREERGGRQTA